MPNHFHIVVPPMGGAEELRYKTGTLLRTVSRLLGPSRIRWDAAPPPKPVEDRVKAITFIRYVHLNPVRAHLTSDPLAWQWSTLREWFVPSSIEKWVDHPEVQRLHQAAPHQINERLWRFTSDDPFCSIDSRQILQPWNPELRPSSARILQAVREVTFHPELPPKLTPLIAHAHLDLGGLSIQRTARELGMSRRGVQKALKRSPREFWKEDLSSIRLWLTNPRLKSLLKSSQEVRTGDPLFNVKKHQSSQDQRTKRL